LRTVFVLAMVRAIHFGASQVGLNDFGQSLNNFRYNPRPSFSAAALALFS
jgi:thiamine biosynthesis protein ThiI